MTSNYFSKTCNKTSKKFFEDFDLLPREIKMMLCHQNRMPTFEDLKAAWELASEEFSIDKLKTNLNVFEEERKEWKKNEAKREKEAKRQERINKQMEKYRRRPVYELVRKEVRPKDAKLIAISEEEAVRRMANRAENKDVTFGGNILTKRFVGYKDELLKENPDMEIKYMEIGAPNHISKQMHNA